MISDGGRADVLVFCHDIKLWMVCLLGLSSFLCCVIHQLNIEWGMQMEMMQSWEEQSIPRASSSTGWSQSTKTHSCILGFKANGVCQNTRPKIICAVNMTAGQSGDPGRINLDRIMDKARKLWETSPQPVKTFPWNRALENFFQLILDLLLAVIKYLSVPVLAVSSLSEMSYCAHEKKLFLIPVPLLIGFAVAGVLRETALELSPLLKDAEVPWHLIAIAIFFTLLKLPGPYYPSWGRILIPHFANGGLLRTLYFAFLWYRRPQKTSETPPPHSS